MATSKLDGSDLEDCPIYKRSTHTPTFQDKYTQTDFPGAIPHTIQLYQNFSRATPMVHIMDVFERRESLRISPKQQWEELLSENQEFPTNREEPVYGTLRKSDYGKNLMAINQLYRSLTNLIRPRDSLLHHMIKNDVLTPNKKSFIQSSVSDDDKAAALVDILVMQPATDFQKFYQSLKDDKQIRVVQIIELYKNPTEGDADTLNISFDVRLGFLDVKKQKKIRDNWPTLVDNIDAENGLIDKLFQKETINLGEKQKISNVMLSQNEKVDMILDLLMRCTNADYDIFIEALKQTNNAAAARLLEIETPENAYLDLESDDIPETVPEVPDIPGSRHEQAVICQSPVIQRLAASVQIPIAPPQQEARPGPTGNGRLPRQMPPPADQRSRLHYEDIDEIHQCTVHKYNQKTSDKLLKKSQPGTYLIRLKTAADTGHFELCCRTGNSVKHYKILNTGRQYNIGTHAFPSLEKVVNFYKRNAIHKDICLKEEYKPDN